ncbi:unnamed protein product, partial [Rotaria sp. Silwood1]
MFTSSAPKERVRVWIILALCTLTNVQSQSTLSPSVSCPGSGFGVCGNQCYNQSTQQCLNGTICSRGQQLCVVKYETWYGYPYSSPSNQCYNPTNQSCWNNSLCEYPYRSCNQRCLRYNELCINNMTVCTTINWYYSYYYSYYYYYFSFYNYQVSQMKSCNGICYDPAFQVCTNSTIQCINNCSGLCYNSSSQQCLNGTVCSRSQQFCFVKYDSTYGYQYNPPYYQCYNPTNQSCLNNSICDYPSRSCNQRCLRYNELCVDNMTVCNMTNSYNNYQVGQVKLCNGTCYDSAVQVCTNGIIRCQNNCSGVCYNSSSQQCLNGTLCSLSQQFCLVKYDSWSGYQYNPSFYQCYNPTYQACFNNSLCDHPSRSCNQRCLRYNE